MIADAQKGSRQADESRLKTVSSRQENRSAKFTKGCIFNCELMMLTMRNILLTGVVCLAPLVAYGKNCAGSMCLDERNADDSSLSAVNRLDRLAGETGNKPENIPITPPVMRQSKVPMSPMPPERKKEPMPSPGVSTMAVIARTGNEIMHAGRNGNHKTANTETSLKEIQSRRSLWNYRRTLESCRF